jgi:hypothetical protein
MISSMPVMTLQLLEVCLRRLNAPMATKPMPNSQRAAGTGTPNRFHRLAVLTQCVCNLTQGLIGFAGLF